MTLETIPTNPFEAQVFGTYRGDWSAPVPRTSLFADKRWSWVGFASQNYFTGMAIVDVGYAANAFAWLFDRNLKKITFDRSVTLPKRLVSVARHPREKLLASATFLPGHIEMRRQREIFTAKFAHPDLRVSLRIDAQDATPASAFCPVSSRRDGFNATRKYAGVDASIQIETDDGVTSEEGVGFLDFSSGRLGRRTEWLWAIGGGQNLSFNAVSRFNDKLENVVWVNGEPRALECEIDRENWRVHGPEVDLTLDVEGSRSQNVALGIVSSQYLQPIGTWRGDLLGKAVALPGVAEDHKTVW